MSVIPAVATERFLAATGTSRGARIPLGSDGPALGVVGATRGFPTLPSGAGGVIVDYPTYAAAAWLADGTILAPTEWWVDVNGPAAQVADRLAAPPFSSVRVVDRAARARELSTDPVALGISGALYIGFVAAAVFAVIGFAVSSAISATERRTEFAVLRSLGLSGRQLSGALALEGGLTAGLALAAGIALGLVLAWLVLPSSRSAIREQGRSRTSSCIFRGRPPRGSKAPCSPRWRSSYSWRSDCSAASAWRRL